MDTMSDRDGVTPQPATEDEGGTQVAGGRAAVEPPKGVPTESKLFASIGAFYLLIGIIYAVTAYEWAGVVLLLLGAAFAFTIAGFMAWNVRGVQYQAEDSEWGPGDGPPTHEGLYLPHTSIWPVGIAIGAALVAAGVAIGWWVWLPGAALLAHSVIGFAAQSRDRT
jgi:hypothetical protein